MVPFIEEEVWRKSETLPPPDGQSSLLTVELEQPNNHRCVSPPDDSWLEITPEHLDEMMRKAAGYLPREKVSQQASGRRESVRYVYMTFVTAY